MKNKYLQLTLIPILIIASCIKEKKKITKVRINQKILTVEIAETEEKRKKGLSHRKKLPENYGMLFIFDKPQIVSFWMKDTSIPLSIAFITSNFTIIQIDDMEPYDVFTIHRSIMPVKYALEVKKGWFRENNIKIGDKIEIINKNSNP